MNERLEYKGYWFLPHDEENKIAGVLTYTPKESIVLELIGSLSTSLSEVVSDSKEVTLIHGFTSDAKKITLINGLQYSSLNFSSFPISSYHCQYLVIGKHLDNFEELSFFKARVLLPYLTEWCHPRALDSSITLKGDSTEFTVAFVRYKDEEKHSINKTKIDDKTDLYLKKCVDYNGSFSNLTPKIEQYTSLEIHKNKDANITEYLSEITLYEHFLSFATLESIECSKIFLYDKEIYQEIEGHDKLYHSIELFYVQTGIRQEIPKAKLHKFLFTYQKIEGQYGDVLHKWHTGKDEIAPIRRLLIESIRTRYSFSSDSFLSVMQALEGFVTRFRTKKIKEIEQTKKQNKQKDTRATLAEKLGLIISEFSSIDKLSKEAINVTETVNSRNYYTHFMNRKSHVLDGLELYDLTHKLRKLLICCLLSFIGFDNSLINEIFNESYNNLLI